MFKRLQTRIIATSKMTGWVCGLISAVATLSLILLTVCDVFLRHVFSKPINGSFELTEYLLIIIVFTAIPWATTRNSHVRVDLLIGKLSARRKAGLYAISCVLSMFVAWLFAWYTIPEVKYAYDIQFKSDMLDIPTYPFYIVIVIGFFLLFFTLLAALIQYINEAVGK